ncbi:hypothetical protein PtB15_12B274 [Puccinia triticina]|nr:hypothetical protein PtB15_12B274 [Puccinia triticina]
MSSSSKSSTDSMGSLTKQEAGKALEEKNSESLGSLRASGAGSDGSEDGSTSDVEPFHELGSSEISDSPSI